MNDHERIAWRQLLELGAKPIDLGGKHALDLSTARPRGAKQWSDFVGAIVSVAGRSGSNRRHVDRRGNQVFVITDDVDAPRVEVGR